MIENGRRPYLMYNVHVQLVQTSIPTFHGTHF